MYFRADNATPVGFTDAAGLLVFDLYRPVAAGCTNQASGLREDWTTRAGETCNGWTSAAAGDKQGVGWLCALDAGLLDGGTVGCGENVVVCVAD